MAEVRTLDNRLAEARQPILILVCWDILEHRQQDYEYAQEANTEGEAAEDAYGVACLANAQSAGKRLDIAE